MKNPVKEKLTKGEVSIGSWLSIAHPTVAEIMAKSGLEWIAIDMEHTGIAINEVEALFQVIEANGVVPLVRLSSNNPILAKRVMDLGAYGTIVPQVNSKEDAEQAVQSIKYAPEGFRGVGLHRAQDHGSGFEENMATANKESLCIVQIEHKDGVAAIEEIVRVPGVDGVFIGPYDLSCSLGIPGQLEHKLVVEAREKVLAARKEVGMVMGSHVVDPDIDEMKRRKEEGYLFLAYSTDAIMLNTHFRKAMGELK